MRTAALLFLIAAAVLLLGNSGSPASAAPVPKHLMKEPENTELAKLQGKWKFESLRIGGRSVPRGPGLTLEIRGDKVLYTSGDLVTTADIKLEAADGVKWFKATNSQRVDGDGKPIGKAEDGTYGYLIDGNTLTMAMGIERNQVDADPAKPTDKTILMVLTRIKDKN